MFRYMDYYIMAYFLTSVIIVVSWFGMLAFWLVISALINPIPYLPYAAGLGSLYAFVLLKLQKYGGLMNKGEKKVSDQLEENVFQLLIHK